MRAAEAQVRQIETDIERLTVRAPVSGAVLQSNVRPGEYAQSGQIPTSLMLLGSVDRLHLSLTAAAPRVFENYTARPPLWLGLAVFTPIVLFSVWYATSARRAL